MILKLETTWKNTKYVHCYYLHHIIVNLLKVKIITVHYEVYKICRSKVNDNYSTKVSMGESYKVFIPYMKWYHDL